MKKNNYINKNEIIQFKKEYYEMGKIIIKGIQGYLKVFNNNFNLKIKELEKNLSEYKNKYYNLLNNNNYIKEDKQENNFNTKSQDIKYDKKISEAECNIINDKEIQKLKNKYEMMMKQKNDEINELNLQILKLNLEKKKLRHQKIKKHIEDMNLDIENNFNDKKIKEIKFQKSELNLLKHKSFDIRKNPNLKIDKTPTKIKDSDINITSNLSNNEILSENQKLKSEIVVLKSKSNNFIKLYFKYKEISDKLNSENKKLVKERDEYKKKKSELNNEIEIIKINNDRMNNIKIKNNILINNNLTIKNKKHNSIEKIKTIKNNQRSPIIKNKVNKNNIKVISNKNQTNNNINNLNIKKFINLQKISKAIEISFKSKKTANINSENKNNQLKNEINNKKILEEENKNKIIIDGLKSQIKKLEQSICKYELEKQIEEKNKKKISDSNSHQINGLNELIKLLKDKNQKLNIEIEKLKNKNDDRVIELVKELNMKDKEMSSLTGKINKLKKELINNGISTPNIDD